MPTLTINFTAPQAARIAAAVGDKLSLGRPATELEVWRWFVDRGRAAVQDYEREQDMKAIAPRAAFDPT